MPLFPLTFTHSRPFDLFHNRPLAAVRLIDPSSGRRSLAYDCLVDTGSDFSILPLSAMSRLGRTHSGGTKRIASLGGSFVLEHEFGIDLNIEGYRITPRQGVCFAASPTAAFLPVLGRVDLLTALTVAMAGSNWYWD